MADLPITSNNCWLWGGLAGGVIPTVLLVLFQLLACFRVAFGEHLLTSLLIMVICIAELPAVIVGRALHLPVENGSIAQIMFDLSSFGCLLAIVFWALSGSLIGCAIDRILSVR
jgi:hypothetical protein